MELYLLCRWSTSHLGFHNRYLFVPLCMYVCRKPKLFLSKICKICNRGYWYNAFSFVKIVMILRFLIFNFFMYETQLAVAQIVLPGIVVGSKPVQNSYKLFSSPFLCVLIRSWEGEFKPKFSHMRRTGQAAKA